MKRTMILIALMAVLAVTALALTTSAQTPPPGSGDWVITDSTTYANQQITINNGDILINGNGHLSLTNVNLRFTGSSDRQLRVSTNARLSVSGGTITSSGGTYAVTINGGVSSIDGCTLTQTSGITLNTWKAKITNNTIDRSSANGISFTPADSYSRPVDISDNLVRNSTNYGIYIIVGDHGNSNVKVVCVGNNVSGSLRTGIHMEANTDTGGFILKENELYRNADDGLYATMTVRTVEFRIDDIRAHNNSNYGVFIRTYSSSMLTKYIYRVTSIGNGGEGVYISFDNQHWDHPVFRNWFVFDNEGGGIQFRNFNCATLEDSYCVNERSQVDYDTTNTNLEIFRTTHRKGNARVTGGAYMITSFRYLNLHATWQNGIPCRYNTVQFEDNAGNVLFTYTSDYEGHLGNHTEWDWRVRETRSTLRHSVTPFLVGGTQRLTGSSFDFDRDLEEDLLFHDIQTPDLTVDKPGTNHVQNTDNLTIDGRCLDAHSGAKLVQVSFDPQPSWNLKVWRNATGTSDWIYSLDPAVDDVYTIYVRAFDWANYPNGMYANITINNVTVDTTAPNLTIIQPLTDIITNQSQLTVLGTTDPDVVTLTINGEYLAAFGGTFNKAIQLNEGINNIILIATDYAGNIANATRVITLDSIAPIMVVRHPINELYTNEITVAIGGVTDREGVTMTVAGDPVTVQADGTWSHTVTLLKGWNFILIDAVDVALNHRVVTHKIYYDPDPPRINVFKPEPNDVINSSVFTIEGSTDPDVNNAQIRVNGIWIGLTNSAFNTEFTLLVEGETELEFYAKDWAGNEKTIIVPIVIDTTAPVIDNLLPIDGEIVNDRIINVTGHTEEDATVYVNGRFADLTDGFFSEQINLEEGDNNVNILVTDVAGNTRPIHRIVVLDTFPPDIFIDGLVGEYMRTSANFITITGNTEPTAELVVAYGPPLDEEPAVLEIIPVDENGEFSYPVLIGKNKTTLVVFWSTDYAGNVGEESFEVKLEVKEEPGFFEDNPAALWGILIVVVVIALAYPVTKIGLDRAYDRRLKVMGYRTQVQPPPGQAPQHPPPGARPQGPPGAPKRGPPGPPRRAPPGPPSDTVRAPPRPPTDEEGGAPPAPRPPREDE
jgi:hypothetical protein